MKNKVLVGETWNDAVHTLMQHFQQYPYEKYEAEDIVYILKQHLLNDTEEESDFADFDKDEHNKQGQSQNKQMA